jgi:hypothetical protein
MRKNAMWMAAKVLGLAALSFILTATLGALIPLGLAAPAGVAPLTLAALSFLDGLADSCMLAWLLIRRRDNGIATVAAVGFLMFLVKFILSQIESLVFGGALGLGLAVISKMILSGGIKTAIIVFVAGLFFGALKPRSAGGREASLVTGTPVAKALRTLALSLFFVALYILCGFFIAWRSPAVRDFYANGSTFDNGLVFLVQIFRGTLWVLVAWLFLALTKSGRVETALMAALVVPVWHALGLLIPSTIMPEAVRLTHLLELFVSLFGFELVAVLVLSWPGRKARG